MSASKCPRPCAPLTIPRSITRDEGSGVLRDRRARGLPLRGRARPGVLSRGVVIDVEAISIEGGDTLNRAGGEMTATPHIVGYQCAGTIREVGDGVDGPPRRPAGRRDDDVGLARRAASPSRRSSRGRCPTAPTSSRSRACRSRSAPPTTASSSSAACRRARPCSSRRARAASASPRSSSRSAPARPCSRPRRATSGSSGCDEFGLDHGINYSNDGLGRRRCAELTGGRGVDLVVDSVGGTILAGSVAVPRATAGACITVGSAGRDPAAARRLGARHGQPVAHRRVPRRRDRDRTARRR